MIKKLGSMLPLAILMALTGCIEATGSKLIASAEATVREAMKDPASVQFRKVQVVQIATAAGNAPIVCGEYNAKNGAGGYTGFEPFAWHPDGKLLARSLFPRDGQKAVDAGIASLCAGLIPQV